MAARHRLGGVNAFARRQQTPGVVPWGCKARAYLAKRLRFSLYSDELIVIDPFVNPWIIKPKYNPIENPNQYKSDTLKLIYFLFQIAPWIDAGIVKLIPDPGELNLNLMHETVRMAKARRGDQQPDISDLEDAHAAGREELRRTISGLPPNELLALVRRSGRELNDQEQQIFLAETRRMREADPLALEQPLANNMRDGQLMAMRAGTNLETAMLICGLTGAFPYTNMRTRWQEILSVQDELSETARIWSPFAKAFQSLEFRFLNNVDPQFAKAIRDDGRLEQFRSLLRKIGKGANEISDLASLDSYARDCKDELIGEHRKAEAEWARIDDDILKWGGTSIGAALIAGQLLPNISGLTAAVLGTVGHLASRHFKRQQFRKTNPMSVFIDLSQKPSPGGVTIF